jgi:hypothetical protein
MTKKTRIQRSLEDLKQELKDQINLLQNACERYDSGLDAIGKHIALSLRVLLHHRGQSKSLLEQLGMRQLEFYDTAGPIDPAELLSKCGFIMMKMSSGEGKYIPRIAGPPNPNHKIRKIPFNQWWSEPVLKAKDGNLFSRYDLIRNVADTDGGAHVDPGLESAYMDLSRKNSLGWSFVKGNIDEAFKGRPELACMRQIAEEVLVTLRENCPEYY